MTPSKPRPPRSSRQSKIFRCRPFYSPATQQAKCYAKPACNLEAHRTRFRLRLAPPFPRRRQRISSSKKSYRTPRGLVRPLISPPLHPPSRTTSRERRAMSYMFTNLGHLRGGLRGSEFSNVRVPSPQHVPASYLTIFTDEATRLWVATHHR